jgi:8-oxo-dGTP pyrophosphatase MutT (NUDIX family)
MTASKSIDKVVCFVLREQKLLVFDHRDYSDAGTQVPAGTVESGEDLDVAALREAAEETGYGFRIVRKLGEVEYVVANLESVPQGHAYQRCHIYQLEPLSDLPDSWSHVVEGSILFDFYWLDLDSCDVLEGRSLACLPLLRLAVESQVTVEKQR